MAPGTALMATAAVQLSKANPDSPVPLVWGRPQNLPGETLIYRGIALFLVLLSTTAWQGALGYGIVALVPAAFVPAVLLTVLHNRRVGASGGSPDGAGEARREPRSEAARAG